MNGQNLLHISIAAVIGGLCLWLGVAYCLPTLLPFFIGALAAGLARPLARRMESALHLPRWVAVFLCVSAVFAVLAVGAWFLVRTLISQLGALARELPVIIRAAGNLEQWLLDLSGRAPAAIAPALSAYTSSLFTQGSHFAQKLSDTALSLVGNFVAGLPNILLFTVTAVASGYMLCARNQTIRLWLSHILPLRWWERVSQLGNQLKTAMGCWLKAQLLLLGVTFALVTIGLLVLGVPYALVLGAGIALIDALPVLGAGMVLLPWAAIAMLRGNVQRGVGLAILFGVTALTRTALEPRVLGRGLGLSPLLTLLALYIGFRLCGVAGMLLFPFGALFLQQMVNMMRQENHLK